MKNLFLPLVLIAVVALVSGCTSPATTGTGNAGGNGAAGGNGDGTEAKMVTVDIQNFAFSPATITVNAGDTVFWKNSDTAPHTITADDGSFQSSTFQNGQTYSHTFSSAGTYSYHCGIHPSMKGTVVVQ